MNRAFHVFKVFVAYPNKPSDVSLILHRNRDKLITFLEAFHTDKEDAQFAEEKALLIEYVISYIYKALLHAIDVITVGHFQL
jgi:calcium binding protein 39